MEDIRGYFCGMQGGRTFHYDGRDSNEIRVNDITQSLTRMDRYNGHGKHFWSVATHTLLCMSIAHELEPDNHLLRYEMLCHDFEEAYVGDVIAPMKRALYPAYHQFIEPIRRAVRKAFDLTGEYPDQCREIDTFASWLETRYLFDYNTWEDVWGQPTPQQYVWDTVSLDIPLQVLTFSRLNFIDAKTEFSRSIAWEISRRLNTSLEEVETAIAEGN